MKPRAEPIVAAIGGFLGARKTTLAVAATNSLHGHGKTCVA